MKKRLVSLLTALGLLFLLSSCGLVLNNEKAEGTGRDSTDESQTVGGTAEPTDSGNGEVRVSFAAAGDNIIHESVYKAAAVRAAASTSGEKKDYRFLEMYSERLRDIVSSADVAFVNQEAPIVPERAVSGYPAFNSPVEAGDALIEMGFDIVNMANNHMLDMEGQCEGLRSTIKYWSSRDVLSIGAYESEADYNTLRVMESKGKHIAILSYTYGTNGNKLNAKSGDLVVPYINDSEIIDQVSRASENADAVIVSMHWGNENTFKTTDEQKRLAKLLSKYGADVVIGHHSHTLQPMEWVENDAGEKTLVIYSLGNFISSQVKAYNMVGGLATFELVFSPEGTVTVENALLTPTMTHYTADGGKLDSQGLPTRTEVSVGLLEDYTSDMCSAHGAQLPELNGAFTLDTLRGYVTGTVDAEFLPDFLK